MKFQTKLTLCKAVFIFIAIVVCALWAFEFRIAAVVVLLIDYIFDFITTGNNKDLKELDIEQELTRNITKLLLELGNGFAFIGR